MRITPAYAGKSCSTRPQRSRTRDHPRVCGEKTFCSQRFCPLPGSPPRMRGKVGEFVPPVGSDRITPAYAGKSCRAGRSRWQARDHPRVCGEKNCPLMYALSVSGSPPRVRGKDHVRLRQQHRTRITPACAGKRAATWTSTARARDHPRVCGEK